MLDFGEHGGAHGSFAVVGEHDGAFHGRAGAEVERGEPPQQGGFHGEVVGVLAIEGGDYFRFRSRAD